MCFIQVPDDKELLSKLHQLRDILPEQGERRIRHNDVRLFQQFDAFRRSEVSVALELVDADFLRIGNSVAIAVAEILQPDGLFAIVTGEEVTVLVFVAGRYQPFQPQRLELVREVEEEVGHARVVAVAQHRLAAKMLLVVRQFALDVLQLGVELVLFGLSGRVEGLVSHVVLSMPAAMPSRREEGNEKARPQSMPTPEAVGQACVEHMGERARGRVCYGSTQGHVGPCLKETTLESVLRFPVWRRLAVAKMGDVWLV